MRNAPGSISTPTIVAIQRSIGGQLNFRDVVKAASQEIHDLLPHNHLDVALMNADETLVTAYETGLHTDWGADTTASAPVSISPIRDLFQAKVDYIVTADAQYDTRFHFSGAFSKPIFAANLHSRLHVPLKVKRRVIGALSLSAHERSIYCENDIDNARLVADVLSSYLFALQQSELARRTEILQVEAEARAEGLRIGALHLTEELENARQTIGMDLHDQTLADLSRISRNLKWLEAKQSVRGCELQPIQEEITHCLRELRVIIDNARPSLLQFFGFCEAVEAILDRWASGSSTLTHCRIHDHGGGAIDALPSNIQVSLYRIVQEAINNAGSHACASAIDVHVRSEGGYISVAVVDDGRGLSPRPGQRSGGIGNMRTRASLIGAALSVSAGPGGAGTCLKIRVPVGAGSATH
ncbi:MAG: sensor histidine kinase [Bradyrhizobium sp.]|nr:MAG: sensor histidine kinase [Bradyrhizobium sp.]